MARYTTEAAVAAAISAAGGNGGVPLLSLVAHTAMADGNGYSNGTDTMATMEQTFTLQGDVRDLSFAFDGGQHDSFWPSVPDDYYVKVAVKLVTDANTVFLPVTWPNGETFLHVTPGSQPVPSVPLPHEFIFEGGDVPYEQPTATLTLRVVVWVDEVGKQWPTRKHGGSGDRYEAGVDKLTVTDSSSIGTVGGEQLVPSLILGRYLASPLPSATIHGDSIGGFTMDALRAAVPGLPATQLSVQSEEGWTIHAAPQSHSIRLRLGSFSPNAIFQYGTNDTLHSAGDQSANMIRSALRFAVSRQRLGIVTYPTTLLPYTTSSDGWTTVGGQTQASADYDLSTTKYNDYFRDGAPVDPGNPLTPLTVGAAGLRAGEAGHPFGYAGCPVFPGADCPGYVEVADTVESARNSRKWDVAPGPVSLTGDGTHPSGAAVLTRATAAWSAAPLVAAFR